MQDSMVLRPLFILKWTAGRPSNSWAVFLKALEKAKLKQIRFHDLRHTYASLRVAKGDNLQDVSKQSEHHSVKFTLDVYSHWMPGKDKNQIDELDAEEAPICTPTATQRVNWPKEKG